MACSARVAALALLCQVLACSADGQCASGHRGPKCSSNADCTNLANCVRCAKSGYCTDVPLGPGPSPGPSPSPSPGPSPSPSVSGCTEGNHSYDYLGLVQGWPNSWCLRSDCQDSYASLNVWTLHGVWPSRVGALAMSYPCDCDTRQFDVSQVSSIKAQLDNYWPSFHSNEAFWAHEWTKHGTCADNAQMKDELSFFTQGLQLRESHDIAAALHKASIAMDGSSHTGTELTDALKSVSGFAPMLGCFEKDGKQYLHEVTFCLDKTTLKDIQCDKSVRSLKNDEVSDCDLTQSIVLMAPKSTSQVIHL